MKGLLTLPHRVSARVVLLLASTGFGATALGVAVQAPDTAVEGRQVVEQVNHLDVESQLGALASHRLDLYRSDATRAGDTVAGVLDRLGVVDTAAARYIRDDAVARSVFSTPQGKSILVRCDTSGRLLEFVARFAALDPARAATHFSRLRIERVGDRFVSTLENAALGSQLKFASGKVESTLFAATDAAGVPDGVAGQMAEVLSGDIDFHRALRRGDSFGLVYEIPTADGEPAPWTNSKGRLIAAEFVNAGRRHSGLWYQDGSGKGGYYSFDGQSKRRDFLASPLEYSRVSSGFAGRMHPLLKQWQLHSGIDYAAPMGTPVRAVGEGWVDFAGAKTGYGNVVEIRHGNDRVTLYAHLKRIDVRLGQHVERGDRVGSVGSTGWATGPHLHFEFKVGGIPRNPAQLASWSEPTRFAAGGQAKFALWAGSLRQQIELSQSTARSEVAAQ